LKKGSTEIHVNLKSDAIIEEHKSNSSISEESKEEKLSEDSKEQTSKN
jgi:hypothetical protein